jgi:hypothetical protein
MVPEHRHDYESEGGDAPFRHHGRIPLKEMARAEIADTLSVLRKMK